MSASEQGLRVYSTKDPYFSADPKIVVFHLDISTMTFIDISGSAVDLLGFPLDRWNEPGFWPDRIHPDDREAALAFCAECTRDKVDHALEYRVIAADGQTVWIYETVDFTDDSLDENIIRGFIVDVSKRVQHEADVRAALVLRDQLLEVVTHKISEPLNTISSFAIMLERHLAQQSDHVGSDYAVGMRGGIEQLSDVTRRLVRAAQKNDLGFEETNRQLDALREGLLAAR